MYVDVDKYQSKTKDMSWHGGYEFILRCLIDVVWKSFWHPLSTIPLHDIGPGLYDAIILRFKICLGVH